MKSFKIYSVVLLLIWIGAIFETVNNLSATSKFVTKKLFFIAPNIIFGSDHYKQLSNQNISSVDRDKNK